MRGEALAQADIRALLEPPAVERLHNYVQLLGKWRRVTNLIAEESFAEVWERHILDAVHLQRQMPAACLWLDIGSGAGLPAIVIASILAETPRARVHCVEIDRRKCAFLRECASQLNVPLKVHNALAEQVTPTLDFPVEVITARAFSSLSRILALAEPQMRNGAVAMLPRGRSAQEEVARLDPALYSVGVKPNPTPGDGVFVQIKLRDARPS